MALTEKEELELLQLLELELIDKAKDHFYTFCQYMDEDFFTEDKPYLKMIANELQAVADGKIKKLAISLPPRAGKSYIVSLFCAWIIGKRKNPSIMRNTYAAKLAEKFSRDIRDGIIPDEKYQKVFPKIVPNGAIDNWSIGRSTQPAYFCAGVGGPITGFGVKDLAILDDAIKNIEEAMSETVIENLWNWYTSTHLSRLESGCPEIIIATRWTRKDPIGVLTDPNSEFYDPNIKVICVPALDDNGKSFCEAVKTTEEYLEIKRITEDFIWEAEFMQHPIESKGLLYPIEELNRFTMADLSSKKPDGIAGFTDTADKGQDYLCSLVGSIYNGYTYIIDVVFTQEGVEVTEPLVSKMIIDTNCYLMKIEANNGGSQYARNIRANIKGKSTCMVTDEHQSNNKETRIIMNAGYIKENFYFRSDYEPGSDYDKYIRALTSYVKMGKNTHDDAPDGTTGLAEYIRYMAFPGKPAEKRRDDFGIYKDDEEEGELTESYVYMGGSW
ncbi:phage terminase large subunit [Dehalobacter restrictus]|uniref:Phage terminase large subunit n=1 Tax=Dehalobacter restrictus TaxID=55583 RepID=A0A857DDV0_9FIRM|nr:phage terminase large subunit [Dehalobacter restrictus]QGZ99423.1 phage terminase large subunit [Dehalobacter restrictus]